MLPRWRTRHRSLAALVGDEQVLAALSLVADPDAALAALDRLLEAAPDGEDLAAALCADEGLRAGLLGVLGASTALGDHLARHPRHWHLLAAEHESGPPRPRCGRTC